MKHICSTRGSAQRSWTTVAPAAVSAATKCIHSRIPIELMKVISLESITTVRAVHAGTWRTSGAPSSRRPRMAR
jgi:hypothetical protein